jgi:hypothetical protein
MISISVRRHILILILSVVLVFSLGSAIYAQPSDSSGDVRIVVYMIEASDGVPGVDPQIKEIIKDLKRELRYSTYKLVSKVPKKIRIGSSEGINLPDSRKLLLYAQGYENGRVKLRVKVTEKSGRGPERSVLNTEFRIVRGGTIIIGPYNYREGKLILAISADK